MMLLLSAAAPVRDEARCLLLVIIFIDLFMMVLIMKAEPRDYSKLMRKKLAVVHKA